MSDTLVAPRIGDFSFCAPGIDPHELPSSGNPNMGSRGNKGGGMFGYAYRALVGVCRTYHIGRKASVAA